MANTPDLILFDTNILVYAANKVSPFHEGAKALREKAEEGELRVCVSLQNLWEFYAVITDPRMVEKPLSPQVAREQVEKYLEAEFIVKLSPTERTLRLALELGFRYNIRGQRFFDLLLVGAMLDHGVSTIYTANIDDFEAIKEVRAVNPFLPE